MARVKIARPSDPDEMIQAKCLGVDIGTSNTKFVGWITGTDYRPFGFYPSRYAEVHENTTHQVLPAYDEQVKINGQWLVFKDAAKVYGVQDMKKLGYQQQYMTDIYRDLLSYTLWQAYGQWTETNGYSFINPDIYLSLSVPVQLYTNASWLNGFANHISGFHEVTNVAGDTIRFNVLSEPQLIQQASGISVYKNKHLKIIPDGYGAFYDYLDKGGDIDGTTIVLNIGMQTYDITVYRDGVFDPTANETTALGGYHLAHALKAKYPSFDGMDVHQLDQVVKDGFIVRFGKKVDITSDIRKQLSMLAKMQASQLASFIQFNRLTDTARILVFGGYGNMCFDELQSNASVFGMKDKNSVQRIGQEIDMYYANAVGSLGFAAKASQAK